ncbi:MAG: Ig-like domain-containing protein [Vicinamibacteria bacterium]
MPLDLTVLSLALLAATPATSTRTPSAGDSLQQALYGIPRDATVRDLLGAPADFEGRAVRVRGRMARASQRGRFQLETEGGPLPLDPVPTIAARVRAQAPRWVGQEVELVGVFVRDSSVEDAAAAGTFLLRFWQYAAPTAPPAPASAGAAPLSLEQLVYGGGKSDGKTVKVVGQFRGSNLRGDLPPATRRAPQDWVLKDDFYAVWITGHGASGDGFELDPLSIEDQETWVEVVGRPETRQGITYLNAQRVALAEPPTGGGALSAPAHQALAGIPPAIVFTLPVNGEDGAPADVRLVVQFNQSMDSGSFTGRVRLRPVDANAGPEEIKIVYDENKKALVVEPARSLPAGRELVLELMDGIIDVHGRALSGAPGGSLEAVRFRVGG